MCGEIFLTEYQMYRHIKNFHSQLEFKCIVHQCPYSCATKEELDKHDNEKHPRVECPVCKKPIQKTYLKTHTDIYHSDNKNFICDVCGATFARQYYLKSHYVLHQNIEPKFECDVCGVK